MDNSKYKIWAVSIIGVLAVISAIFLFAAVFGAPERNAEPELFVVPLNSESSTLIKTLKSKGFIKSEVGFYLVWQLKNKNLSGIQPGGYKIAKSMKVWEVVETLTGEPFMKWVIIPEGWRKEQIADILGDILGWTNQQKSDWVKIYTSIKFDEIEGVYFPDTYLIPVEEEPEAVAGRLRTRFNEVFAPYLEEANKQNIKWTTLLKIASLVQREAAEENDMPLIAGIIWNRLLNDQKLDIDATVQYARDTRLAYKKESESHEDLNSSLTGEYLGIDDWWSPISVADKNINSLYNTYLYKGLPPHPIANPGENAIKATLFPEKTDCLYYLHDKERNIHCSATYEEHQEKIKQFLR